MKQWTSAFLILGLAAAGTARGDEPKPKTWQTEVVKRGSLEAAVHAKGPLEPVAVIDVRAPVRGQILKFGADPNDPKKLVDYGTLVDQGTVLAQLDPRLHEVRVDRARAGLKRARAQLVINKTKLRQAEREFQRAKALKAKGTIADADFDAVKAAYEIAAATVEDSEAAIQGAEVALKEAEIKLHFTAIRSPVKGVIIDRRVNLGQTVGPDRDDPSLFAIATDLTRLQVWASVSETDISKIRKGQAARFYVDAYPNKVFEGKVSQIRLGASKDKNVVSYTVIIDVDNSKFLLLPYLTCRVQIIGRQAKQILLVPNTALLRRPPLEQVVKDAREKYQNWIRDLPRIRLGPPLEEVVWVPAGNYLRPVYVTLGTTDTVMTEVLKGDLDGKAVVLGEAKAPAKGKDGRGK
jgi:HlyD family secretion protein